MHWARSPLTLMVTERCIKLVAFVFCLVETQEGRFAVPELNQQRANQTLEDSQNLVTSLLVDGLIVQWSLGTKHLQ